MTDPIEHRQRSLARLRSRLRAGVSPDQQRPIIREMAELCQWLRIGLYDYLVAPIEPAVSSKPSPPEPVLQPGKSPDKPATSPMPLPGKFPAKCPKCGRLCPSKESWYAHGRKHQNGR